MNIKCESMTVAQAYMKYDRLTQDFKEWFLSLDVFTGAILFVVFVCVIFWIISLD